MFFFHLNLLFFFLDKKILLKKIVENVYELVKNV